MRFCEGCQLCSILFPLLLAELEVGSGTEKRKGSVHGILRTLLDVSEDLMEPYFTVRIAVSCGAAGLLDGSWNGRVIVLIHSLLAVCCPLCWGCEGIYFSTSCISSLCWQRCFHFFLLKWAETEKEGGSGAWGSVVMAYMFSSVTRKGLGFNDESPFFFSFQWKRHAQKKKHLLYYDIESESMLLCLMGNECWRICSTE